MDEDNHMDLSAKANPEQQLKIKYLLDFASNSNTKEVPDPYYGYGNGFEVVLDLVEDASKGLLAHIKAAHL